MSKIRHFPGLWLADNEQPRPLIGCWLSALVSLSHLPWSLSHSPRTQHWHWVLTSPTWLSLHHWQSRLHLSSNSVEASLACIALTLWQPHFSEYLLLAYFSRLVCKVITRMPTLSTKMRISFLNTFPLFSGSSSLPQTHAVPSAGWWPSSPGSASSLSIRLIDRI